MTRALWSPEEGEPYPGDDHFVVEGISGVLITNVILLVPMLLLLGRWRPPFGALTLLFGGVAVLSTALVAFATAVVAVPAALAGGVVGDLLVRRLGPRLERPNALRLVACLVPVALWGSWFLAHELRWGLQWSPELWSGTIVFAALSGLGLVELMVAPARPAARTG